jgi:nucleoside-diphosphate-sugar epimerase
MRVFVAGATGAVGRRLVPLLLQAGHEVIAATRRAEKLATLGARGVVLDLLDRESVLGALRSARPDVVLHQVTDLANLDLDANARVRITGTRNLVDAARSAGVRRMVAQSIAFAYAPGHGRASESDPLHQAAPPPRGRTVEGVVALERTVAEMPEGVVLRYGSLYGEGTWYAPGGTVAESVRAGRRSATPGITSFLHVDDAAQAAVAALDWPPGVVNIVDDEPAPGTEWVPFLARLLGGPPPPRTERADPWERGATNARARNELAWMPRWPSWRNGFREVFRLRFSG